MLDNFEHLWTERRWSTRSYGRRRGTRGPRHLARQVNSGAETVFGLTGIDVPAVRAGHVGGSNFSGVELFVDSAASEAGLRSRRARRRRARWVTRSQLVEGMPLAMRTGRLLGQRSHAGGGDRQQDGGLRVFLAADRRRAEHAQPQHPLGLHWTLLPGADERALFSRLGVFRGGFTRASAVARRCVRLRRWSTSRS